MSEPAPEIPRAPRPKAPAPSKGGLNKKVGPLPVWAWGAIIIGTIGFILFVRSKTNKGGTVSPADTSGLFDPGGGPPAPPANGVVPPGWTDPCPPGFTLVSGACVPDPVSSIPPGEVPPGIPPGIVPHPIIGPPVPVMPETAGVGLSGAQGAVKQITSQRHATPMLKHHLANSAASTEHASVKRLRKH